ncbi:uncharacterized protein [Drosophila tropicalis]|uniref:uncharacterized protein n=1 Tax=Drosophila tropicalis TaxID=46794 RepID=UPI0035ABCF47
MLLRRLLGLPRLVRHVHYQHGSMPRHILVHPDIKSALKHNQPIVALESTIITHGMPMPENVETALQVEEEVRQAGAIPATIGILDGCIRVGLTGEELKELACKPREEVIKCSRRDLPYVVASCKSGGTTVAATMLLAHQVGIDIFATGGIGGVHREGHITMDVSADLVELGRTPVAVICSGIKSILDIPRTLEYLETQGVCVASFESPQRMFPDFFTRDSQCQVPYNLNTIQEAAKLLRSWKGLNLQSGALIGVPIPHKFAANKKEIDQAIIDANQKALENGIKGKDVTPFLLKAITEITKGKSLESNMALIKNNAKIAGQIAKEMKTPKQQIFPSSSLSTSSVASPLVIGASILDLSFQYKSSDRELNLDGGTYKATSQLTAGGVGRNIAEGLYKLYGQVNLISAIGRDKLGQSLCQLMPKEMQSHLILDENQATSLCSLVFDKSGDCKLILGNMDIHSISISPELLLQQSQLFSQAPLVIMDSNISVESMETVLNLAAKYNLPVFFEPTDMFIAGKPFTLSPQLTQHIRLIKPNLKELQTIVETITGEKVSPSSTLPAANERSQLLSATKELVKKIDRHFNCIISTLGDHGVLLSYRSDASQNVEALLDVSPPAKHITRFFEAPLVENIKNVSGAGDSFCAGFITSLLRCHKVEECVAAGFVAAGRALQSHSAVPETYFKCPEEFELRYKETLKILQHQTIG